MLYDNESIQRVTQLVQSQWHHEPQPPPTLLEQRVLEMEGLGLLDEEEAPGVPSSIRQYAMVSLRHHKPSYFITVDDQILSYRDMLEFRYGMPILSVFEAVILLRNAGHNA